ncbi:MAG: copper homeostasis protein CutC [Muribaculaceae bacterium]|nr:copper homeostasis protein CutC [Muribaculaceae bacterium]
MKPHFLEICCGDLRSLHAAREGGADRIELCSALSEGGMTPSIGLIREAAQSGIREIKVLIRPRSGDFLYSEEEISLMEEDITEAVRAGATGVVIGCLKADGHINLIHNYRLIQAARKASDRYIGVTFHRAFDVSANPLISLEDIIELGCDCLLTSGQAKNATEGKELLRELKQRACGRIKIMAGAGVTPANAVDILRFTGVDGIHSTAREAYESEMIFRRPAVPMGACGTDEFVTLRTSPRVVSRLKGIIDNLSKSRFSI